MNTVFLAGHARLPAGMAAQNMNETLIITAEVDKKYGVIITASCTLATAHGQDFIHQLLRGHSLIDGIEKPIENLQNYYLGKASNALSSALKNLYKQYESYTAAKV